MPCKILADSHGSSKVAKSDAEDRNRMKLYISHWKWGEI